MTNAVVKRKKLLCLNFPLARRSPSQRGGLADCSEYLPIYCSLFAHHSLGRLLGTKEIVLKQRFFVAIFRHYTLFLG